MGCASSRHKLVETKNFTTVIVRNYPVGWHSIECFLHAEMNHKYPNHSLSIHLKNMSSNVTTKFASNSTFVIYEIKSTYHQSIYKVQYTFDDPITPLYSVNELQVPNICKRWPKSDRHVLKSVVEFHQRYLHYHRKPNQSPWSNIIGQDHDSISTQHIYANAFDGALRNRIYYNRTL